MKVANTNQHNHLNQINQPSKANFSKIYNCNLNGWLILDKPVGYSSHDIIHYVRKTLKMKKVGHAGTLDPLASGMLIIGLGEATKLMQYALNQNKEYEFSVKFGTQTTTDDQEGEILHKSNNIPTINEIQNILPDFIGDIDQVPPLYSAIKLNGQKLCNLMRKNDDISDIKLPARKLNIKNLELISYNNAEAYFNVTCSKGTYIRALARDLAIKLNSRGHVKTLIRKKIGDFDEKMIISMEIYKKMLHNNELDSYLLPVHAVLSKVPKVQLNSVEAKNIQSGMMLSNKLDWPIANNSIIYQAVDENDKLLALVKLKNNKLKPFKVFNL